MTITAEKANKIIDRRGEDTYVDTIDIQSASLDPEWGTPRIDLDDVTTTTTEKMVWQKNIVGEKNQGAGEDNLGISTVFGRADNPANNDPRYEYRFRRIYASGTYDLIEMKPYLIDSEGTCIYKEFWVRRMAPR